MLRFVGALGGVCGFCSLLFAACGSDAVATDDGGPADSSPNEADADLVAGDDGIVDADGEAASDGDADVDADADADTEGDPDADAGTEADSDDASAAICGNGIVESGEECDSDLPRPCATSCGSTGSQACTWCDWDSACAPPAETCNEVDDDCDTLTDEDCGDLSPCSTDAPCISSALICNEAWGLCVVPDCTSQPDFAPCEVITSPDRSYDICVEGACISPGCGDTTCNAPGPNWTLADTGQRLCYDESVALASCPGTPGTAGCETTAFCGQDAQYGWDVTHAAAERFTRTTGTEPVVADNVTGLMWMGCTDGRTGDTCTGTAMTYTWAAAVTRCDGRSWGGFSDWRLPDEYELGSIVDYGTASGATIDPVAFPGTPPSNFWSSSPYAGLGSIAWYVGFGDGFTNGHDRANPNYVRCVRAEPAASSGRRFARTEPVAGQPVVADATTGLVWQGCIRGRTGTGCTDGVAATGAWRPVLDSCQDSTWAGFTDWYLPNVAELRSIVDNRVTNPAVDATMFPNTPSDFAWSSSPSAQHRFLAFGVGFYSGHVSDAGKAFGGNVRCVRRGP